jgi:phenylalanine-4-hydroxylase
MYSYPTAGQPATLQQQQQQQQQQAYQQANAAAWYVSQSLKFLMTSSACCPDFLAPIHILSHISRMVISAL